MNTPESEMRECTEEEKKEFHDMFPPPPPRNPSKRNGVHDALRVIFWASLGTLAYLFPFHVLIGYLALAYLCMGYLLLSGTMITANWKWSLLYWLFSPILLPLLLLFCSFLLM